MILVHIMQVWYTFLNKVDSNQAASQETGDLRPCTGRGVWSGLLVFWRWSYRSYKSEKVREVKGSLTIIFASRPPNRLNQPAGVTSHGKGQIRF